MGLWIIQNIKKELEDRYTFPELSEMAKNFQGKKYIIDELYLFFVNLM